MAQETRTYICSATRIRPRWRSLVPFFIASARASIAARRTPGNVSTRLLGMPLFPWYHTCTVWESPQAMAEFVRTPTHRVAMAGMDRWAMTGRFVRFESTRRRPSWLQAFRALRTPDGIWTRGVGPTYRRTAE